MCRDIGHVEFRQDLLGRLGVVVRGPADQRKAGQGNNCVDGGAVVVQQKSLDGRPRVQPGGKHGHHVQSTGFQRVDHAVVMAGVPGQQVRAHQQQADRSARAGGGQRFRRLGNAVHHPRVIDADLGILRRRLDPERTAQYAAGPGGVAVDQEPDHVGDVFLRSAQPVLEREEIRAHVLRGSWNET